MADNFPIILEARADTTQFFRDIADATNKAQRNIKPLRITFDDKASLPLGKIRGEVSEFNKSIDAATARVIAFSATTGILYGVANAFKALVRETIEVEKTLTEINTVLNTNQKTLESFNNSLFDIAKNTAQSYKTVATAALELSRQGLSVEETLKRTESALILTRISGLDAAQAVNTLTAAINGFTRAALDGEEIVNKLASVDAAFAVSTKDLAEALTRVGATAQDANVSFEELVATVTAVQQTTSRGGAVIGNALKTIFTRIGRDDTIQQLKNLGVAIDESQGGVEKLKAISQRIGEVNVGTGNLIKELAGGVFQINIVSAALGDLSKGFSVYDNALRIANGSTGDAIRRNELLNQSISALVSQSSTAIDELISKIGQISLGNNLNTLFAGFNDFISGLGDAIDAEPLGIKVGKGLLEGLGNFISGPGIAIALGAFLKLTKNLAADAFGAFKQVVGITSESDKQALLQKQIGSYLEANAGRYAGIKNNLAQINALQADFINKLAAEARVRADINNASKAVAASLVNKVSVNKTGRDTVLVPRAASGFIPSMNREMLDIRAGTGGAKSNDKPVYIPKFNFGDKVGPVIANTGEKIVENFLGGGGSAILNRDMIEALGGEENLNKYGKVKALAGGYTPNVASLDSLPSFSNGYAPMIKQAAAGIIPSISIEDVTNKIYDSLDKLAVKFPKFDSFLDKVLGKASSFSTGIAPTVSSFANKELRSPKGTFVANALTQEVNQSLAALSTTNDTRVASQSISTLRKAQKKLGEASANMIDDAMDSAFKEFQRNKVQVSRTQLRAKGGGYITADLTSELNKVLSVASRTNSPADAAEASRRIDEIKNKLADSSIKDVEKRLSTALNLSKGRRVSTANLQESIFSQAQQKLSSASMFRLVGRSTDDTLDNISGYSQLPPAEQKALRERVKQENKALRGQRFQNAGLGISIGASLAAPFVGQAQEAAQNSGNQGAANGLGVAGSALQGASFGAFLGLGGLAGGVGIGALYGVLDVMDQSDETFKRLSKTLEDLNATTSQSLNGLSNYIQLQEKLGSVIDAGGSPQDVAKVNNQLIAAFASISNPNLRRDALNASGDPKQLSSLFAETQFNASRDVARQEAAVIAAKERDRLTDFYDVGQSPTPFRADAIEGITSSIIASLDPTKISEYNKALSELDGNFSSEGFSKTLKSLGIEGKNAEDILEALRDSVNKLAVFDNLKEKLNFAKELEESIRKSSLYKASLVDLNKTLNSIIALQNSNARVAAEKRENAFTLGSTQAQNRASIDFFNTSDFGKAQLSTAFGIERVKFDAQSDRESTTREFQEELSSFIKDNYRILEANGDLLKETREIARTGSGDLEGTIGKTLEAAFKNGQDNPVIAELARILQEQKNSLVSIDDKEALQISLAKENLRFQKERQVLESRLNFLGGAEGALNFKAENLNTFKDRALLQPSASGDAGRFGRNQQAAGILEFQKNFGNLEGFDVRKFIPDAREKISSAILENTTRQLSSLGIPLNKTNITELEKSANLQADAALGKKELSSENIGQAVASMFDYEKLALASGERFSSALDSSRMTGYSSNIPEIYKFLQARFTLENQRAERQKDLLGAQKEQQLIKGQVRNTEADTLSLIASNGQINKNSKTNLITPNYVESRIDYLTQGFENSRNNFNPQEISRKSNEALLENLFNGKSSISASTLEKNANNLLGQGNFSLPSTLDARDALRSFLEPKGGLIEKDGKSVLTQEGIQALFKQFYESNGVSNLEGVKDRINENQSKITELTSQLNTASESVRFFEDSVKKASEGIESQKAKGISSFTALTPTNPTSFEPAFLKSLDLSTARLSKAVDKTTSIVPYASEDARASGLASLVEQREKERSALARQFGPRNTIGSIKDSMASSFGSASRTDLSDYQNRRLDFNAENRLLTQAFNARRNGQYNPNDISELRGAGYNVSQNVGARGSDSVVAALNASNAQSRALSISDEIRGDYASGSSQNELRRKAIEIQKTLDRYVETQVSLGYDRAEVEATAKKMRETIQNELNDLEIKIPRNKLEEFGVGFSSRLEELQTQFDDLSAVGAQTADSLAMGFGDAFVDVISGAKTAEDAVRGLLSSVASDLARFFAKRAFVNAFGSMFGGFGGTGGFNQGGLVKRASGGPIGKVPALVMGGEYKFDKNVVAAYGEDFFRDLNAGKVDMPKYASGGKVGGSGLIKGGSGNKDDIFGHFDEGTFILRKSAVAKYGTKFLDNISEGPESKHSHGGKVQRAFWGALLGQILGGVLQGAVVGGATAAITGGDWKTGALLGGIGGGLAGGISGYSSAQGATGGFGSQFMGGFQNSFSWMGFGKNGSSSTSGTASATTPSGLTSTDMNTGAALTGINPNDGATITSQNGGYATGVGNNSFTSNDVGVKMPTGLVQDSTSFNSTLSNNSAYINGPAAKPQMGFWGKLGTNLGGAAALTGASMLLAPETDPVTNSKTIKGQGSITTYNDDGTVEINTASGTKIVRPGTDFNNIEELQAVVKQNGGQFPEPGTVQGFAKGGSVSGTGGISIREKNKLNFPSLPSPYITTGSGMKDDVPAKLKKGEFVLNTEATDHFGIDLLSRMNSLSVNKQDLGMDKGGILKFANGGPVEYDPANRDRGMFSMAGASDMPTQTPVVGGGGNSNSPINIEINVNIGSNGEASSNTSVSGSKKDSETNTVQGQHFANKVKMLFMELVEQEKRPGGLLNKENM